MKKILLIKLVKSFLKDNNTNKLREFLKTIHIVDLAEAILTLNIKERATLYQEMTPLQLSELILEVSLEIQEEIISLIDNEKLKYMLEAMSNDDIVDIFGELSEDEVKHLMRLLDKKDREEVQRLRQHESDTAGGLMTTDYFSVVIGTLVKQVIAGIKKNGEEAELLYYVYIVDSDNTLLGVVSLKELILANPEIPIEKIMKTNIISAKPEMEQEYVASYFSKYDLIALPVVDELSKLLGIITVDDILDVMEEESKSNIYAMAGLREQDNEDLKISGSIKIRLPWLLVSFIGEMISAYIMHKYDAILTKMVALAFFVPLIMAMGGNSGSQSSAIMVRKIALGEIEDLKKIRKMVFKETLAGIFLGLITGILAGVTAYFWPNGDVKLAFIIGIGLFVAVSFAAFSGSVIPLAFNKFKFDPAVASGPFITTLNDVGGILIYLSLAAFLLNTMY